MPRPDAALFAAMLAYAAKGYPMQVIAAPRCAACGGEAFQVSVDDNEGAAVRVCAACGEGHPIADSCDYLDGAELEACECPCGQDVFRLRVGAALFEGSRDVRWIYLGLQCLACQQAAVYADWKLDGDPSYLYLKGA